MTQQVLSSAGAIKESNSFGNAGYGTSLPASPTDGMEYILVDSVSAPTYQWRFRWNNGSGNTDKWEFCGGPPALSSVATSESTSSATYTSLATAQNITAPRAGQYQVGFAATVYGSTAGNGLNMGIKVGATEATDANGCTWVGQGANFDVQPTRIFQYTAAASDVFTLRFKSGGSTNMTAKGRMMWVTPVRVS